MVLSFIGKVIKHVMQARIIKKKLAHVEDAAKPSILFLMDTNLVTPFLFCYLKFAIAMNLEVACGLIDLLCFTYTFKLVSSAIHHLPHVALQQSFPGEGLVYPVS